MNDQAITLSAGAPTDFTGLKLIQSATGHVRTPWFTCDMRGQGGILGAQAAYHRMRLASRSAFAAALGISEWDMVFSEKQDPTDPQYRSWWCWGTKNPMKLPEVKPRDPLAIDI